MSELRFNFTQSTLEQLTPTDKQYEVRDTKIIGLYFRVSPGGTKTYYLYRKLNGKTIRYKIGRFCNYSVIEARLKAKKLNVKIDEGINPQHEKKTIRQELTFKELYEIYYKQHTLVVTKNPKDTEDLVNRHIMPILRNYRLCDITREKVKQIHLKIGATHKVAANHVVARISAIFNFGIDNGYYTGNNPCRGVKKYKVYSRDRFLDFDELLKYFEALEHEIPVVRDYFLGLLFTGARKTNLIKVEFDHVDFTLRRWRISEKEAKNKDVNIITLTDDALAVFKRRKEENDKSPHPSKYIFPSENPEKHIQSVSYIFERIKDFMKVSDIRIHDLRRTFASYMAIGGTSLTIIAEALNHKSQSSTKVYARLNTETVRDAMNAATKLMRQNKSF